MCLLLRQFCLEDLRQESVDSHSSAVKRDYLQIGVVSARKTSFLIRFHTCSDQNDASLPQDLVRQNQVVIDYPIDFFNNFEERTWEELSTGHDWGSWRHPTQHRLLILASIYSQLCQDPSRKQELRPYFTHAHGALRKVLVDHEMIYTQCNQLCVQLGDLFDDF